MVRLVPMTKTEFQAYLEIGIPTYAQENVKAGRWHPSEALEGAQKEFQTLLPAGLATENHYLFSIVDDRLGANVGMIWFAVQPRGADQLAYIYDVLIFEPLRRRGYGRQAMRLVEEKVKEFGIDEMRLHVFGHNQAARALYEQLGYTVTNLRMAKRLCAATG